MATGSKGASSKKSPASTYSSAIVFLLILIFVTRSSALDVVLSLVLLVTIVIWVVQGQRAKATRSKSGGYHESASNEQDLGIVNRSTTKQKHVIERRPRSPAGRVRSCPSPRRIDVFRNRVRRTPTNANSNVRTTSSKQYALGPPRYHFIPLQPHPCAGPRVLT